MPPLREIQFAMADAAIHVAGSGGALGLVRPNGLPPAARLAIHRNNVQASLTQTLAATYPVVERLTGADFFHHVAVRHAVGFVSETGNLIDYGGGMAVFLDHLPQARSLPYLPDVARLEWALHEVYHVRADAPFDLAVLQTFSPDALPALKLRLNAGARLVASEFPILRIWLANQAGSDDEATIDLDDGAAHLLVLQRDLDAQLVELQIAEYEWLRTLAAGATLQVAYDAATTLDPLFDLPASLLRHVQLGTFAAPVTHT